jgi:hypothetical protein
MDEDNEVLFERKDLRRKKDKKRQHKTIKENEECTRESFKKMKDEIDDLRRKELERARELEELRKKIEQSEKESADTAPKKREEKVVYALEFDKDIYINKGFIESAIWIKNVLAKNLIEKISRNENSQRFASMMTAKKSSTYLGYRACARFNRGEECNLGKWHLTHKPDGIWTKQRQLELNQPKLNQTLNTNQDQQVKRNELRLHVCTLCLEAFGSALGHSVLNCPWIQQKNWTDESAK